MNGAETTSRYSEMVQHGHRLRDYGFHLRLIAMSILIAGIALSLQLPRYPMLISMLAFVIAGIFCYVLSYFAEVGGNMCLYWAESILDKSWDAPSPTETTSQKANI